DSRLRGNDDVVATPTRFERVTFPLGGGCSIQLSYGALTQRLSQPGCPEATRAYQPRSISRNASASLASGSAVLGRSSIACSAGGGGTGWPSSGSTTSGNL